MLITLHCTDAQADLRRCAHMAKRVFLMTWLIYSCITCKFLFVFCRCTEVSRPIHRHLISRVCQDHRTHMTEGWFSLLDLKTTWYCYTAWENFFLYKKKRMFVTSMFVGYLIFIRNLNNLHDRLKTRYSHMMFRDD